MKLKCLLLLPLFLSPIIASAQHHHIQLDTTQHYTFHINYWFNMHHFLWLENFMNTKVDSTLITQKLLEQDQQILKTTLAFYKTNFTNADLRMDDFLTTFKVWITAPDTDIKNIPAQFQPLMDVLMSFDNTYKAHFWPQHQKACQQALTDNLPLIRKTEAAYVDQITTLTRQFWQDEKVKVDVTYYAKQSKWNMRNRPYTSIFPTHVVMNVVGDNEIPGNWLELLYHESAHPLILTNSYFVAGTINDIAEVEGLKKTRQQWHAYLFYFTGQITKDLLIEQGLDYPLTYMERNGIFGRYYTLLDKHLGPYIDRKITLHDATRNFLNAVNNK